MLILSRKAKAFLLFLNVDAWAKYPDVRASGRVV